MVTTESKMEIFFQTENLTFLRVVFGWKEFKIGYFLCWNLEHNHNNWNFSVLSVNLKELSLHGRFFHSRMTFPSDNFHYLSNGHHYLVIVFAVWMEGWSIERQRVGPRQFEKDEAKGEREKSSSLSRERQLCASSFFLPGDNVSSQVLAEAFRITSLVGLGIFKIHSFLFKADITQTL